VVDSELYHYTYHIPFTKNHYLCIGIIKGLLGGRVKPYGRLIALFPAGVRSTYQAYYGRHIHDASSLINV
jgi:hypothetical protein